MINRKKKMLRFNSQEFLFFISEDLFPAMGILITIRFKTKHRPEVIREAMRYMISIYPRLRSVIEPTLFSYGMKIHDDCEKKVEVLFNDAFRVGFDILHDTEEFVDYREALLNESFSLEQGLPIKIRYLPDDPMPVLLLSIHHTTCDGMGWVHMVNSLMMYLNSKEPQFVPVDNPSFIPALIEKPYYSVFQQLYRSYKILWKDIKESKNDTVIPTSSRCSDFYGPFGMHQHFLSFDLKRLVTKSRELNCSLTALILSALAISISRRRKNNRGNVIRFIIPFNIRPYFDGKAPVFGNYTLPAMIRIHRKNVDVPLELTKEINDQLNRHKERFKQKQLIFPYLIEKLLSLAGKKMYTLAAGYIKRKQLFPFTCIVSNLGDLSEMATYGTKAQVGEVIATVPNRGLVITLSSIDNRINTNFTYSKDELARDEVKEMIKNFEFELDKLLSI